MKPAWFVRGYKEGDEYGMAKLMQLEWVGDEDYWRDLWMWECAKNPMGHLTTVSEHNGQIVGKMSLVLARMKVGNETLVGSQAVDLVVHPRFRGQGMFLAIGKNLLSEAGQRGVPISYGLPNRLAHEGHLKYGWFDVCNVPVFVKILDTYGTLQHVTDRYRFIKILNRSGTSKLMMDLLLRISSFCLSIALKIFAKGGADSDLKKTNITRIYRFDERVDNLWQNVSRNYLISVVRNSTYLNWRYFDKPHPEYAVFAVEAGKDFLGYIVLRVRGTSGSIADILAYRDKRLIQSLLSSAIDYFKLKKVNWITFVVLPDSLLYKVLRKNGFTLVKSEIPLIARVNSEGISDAFVRDVKHWHLTAGDSVNRII